MIKQVQLSTIAESTYPLNDSESEEQGDNNEALNNLNLAKDPDPIVYPIEKLRTVDH